MEMTMSKLKINVNILDDDKERIERRICKCTDGIYRCPINNGIWILLDESALFIENNNVRGYRRYASNIANISVVKFNSRVNLTFQNVE